MIALTRNNQPRSSNRRVSTSRQRKQQHLLDVRVRARRASHHRNRRILIFLCKIVLLVAICVGAYYSVRTGLNRFFFQNPDYRLSTVAIQTDGTLTRDQALKTSGLVEGLNIFSVNLAQVHDRLQELAQVDEVQVERKMPNEIDITITERKPIAWITSEKTVADPFISDAAFLVDARGILMKEKKLLPEYLALPLITGCSSEALVPGKAVDSFEAKAALELLRLTTTSFMQTRFQIREVDVSKGYCLLVTDKNHTQVMFGFDDLGTQMQRLEQFLVYSDDSQRQIETVNLLVTRNIPVTFAQPDLAVISELEPELQMIAPTPPASAAHEQKSELKQETKTAAREPEIRKAMPVQPLVKKALPYSPGVKKFHSSPPPLPVRRAVPLQRFKQEGNNGHG
ncbi:MAG TPA: FtsQ-type POTRA domain-containing protein [Chthoniobacterales bacterium]|jgi:cell division septal protein FtsQ|nr:FtsQ-type POTRA domain-containing protein [Chthoniobacterales bacterium]